MNPFGCPGLQNKKLSTPAAIAIKTAVITGVVVTSPLLLAAAIIGGPIYGAFKLHKYRARRRYNGY